MFKKNLPVHWIEVNAKILMSDLSFQSWGTDLSFAKNESSRRVTLTVEIPLTNGEKVVATKKFWTLTKNGAFFEKGKYIAILYNREKPSDFKLKYTI